MATNRPHFATRIACPTLSGFRYWLTLLLLLAFPLALFACGGSERDEPFPTLKDEGDFVLEYQDVDDAQLQPLVTALRQAEVIQPELDYLNETFALVGDVTVSVQTCDEGNAFYEPDTRTILLCYELFDEIALQFDEDYELGDDAFLAALDAGVFFLHHEVGHALVDLYELPVTGREEDAVDELAAILIIEGWDGGDLAVLTAADSFFNSGLEESAEVESPEDLPFWDEHSLDLQRFYSVACLVYGSNPEAHAGLLADGTVPEENAELCQETYGIKLDTWSFLLEPYFLPESEDEEA